MSNYLAIATVTAALQRTLQAAVQVDVEGARVTTIRPSSLGNGTPQTGVNLYLYQTVLNPVWHNNADARIRHRKGEIAKRSRTALDLHYLMSCYGNEVELEPQRLLGSIVSILSDRQTLTAQTIRETTADANFRYLRGSNLSEQVEEISFYPLDLSLEDLSKVWSVFLQTPYTLSIAYRATVVIVEGEDVAKKALPVRDRIFNGVRPFSSQPQIDEVIAAAGKFEPILAESTLLIRGKHLQEQMTQIRFGTVEVTPPQVSETQITLPLALLPETALRAGVQSLQVLHRTPNGRGSPAHFVGDIESNVAPFVLRPSITALQVLEIEGSGDELRSGTLHVEVNLAIGKGQRVILAIDAWFLDNPTAYLLDVLPRQSDTHTLRVPFRDIKPGQYLARLHVDGAESPLIVDTNSDSSTFNWYVEPRIAIV